METASDQVMPCTHPIDMRKSPGGKVSTRVMTPFDKLFKVPCGRCMDCKLEQSRQWAQRGMNEASQHSENCWLTLTIAKANYRPEDLDAFCAHQDMCTKAKSAVEFSTAGEMARPMTTSVLARSPAVDNSPSNIRARPRPAAPEGTGESLSIRDHQLFVKRLIARLRWYGPIKPVRFMMCGEYGEKKGRPHYHYVIFGYDFPDKVATKKRNGFQVYRSSLLESLWPHGYSEIGSCTFESIAYVARYVTKKISGDAAIEHYKRTLPCGCEYWLQPEFNAMSRNPGIGAKWIDKYHTSVYPHDRVVSRGKPAKPPRYYDNYMKKNYPDTLKAVQEKREAANHSRDNSPERLRAREAITLARQKLKRPLEK